MSVISMKITPEEIAERNVKSVIGRFLTGTITQNKHVFDKLPEYIAERINGLIEVIISELANELIIKYPLYEQDENGNWIQIFDEDGNPVYGEYSLNEFITWITGIASQRVASLNGLRGNVEIAPDIAGTVNVRMSGNKILLEALGEVPFPHHKHHETGGIDVIEDVYHAVFVE